RCLNHLTNGPYILGWRRARDSNPRDRGCGLHDFQSCSFNQLGQLSMAPQAGFEPATDRLTADCSTAELLRNIFSNALNLFYYAYHCDDYENNTSNLMACQWFFIIFSLSKCLINLTRNGLFVNGYYLVLL